MISALPVVRRIFRIITKEIRNAKPCLATATDPWESDTDGTDASTDASTDAAAIASKGTGAGVDTDTSSSRQESKRRVRSGFRSPDSDSDTDTDTDAESSAAPPPSKRARSRIPASAGLASSSPAPQRPARFTMAIADTETLAITDTDPERTVMAHELLYALITGYGLYGRAMANKINFVDNMLAALSTPFAAFYVNLGERTVRTTLKDMIRTALECHVEQEFEFSSIPNGKIVGRHVVGRNTSYTTRKLGPVDKECAAEFQKLVDQAVDRCVTHLDAIRAYWMDRKARVVQTSLICITTPRKPGDGVRTTTRPTTQVDVDALMLPLEAIPVPALQKVTSSSTGSTGSSSSPQPTTTGSGSGSAAQPTSGSGSPATNPTTVYQPTPEERAEVANLFGQSSLAAVKGCLISHVLAEPLVYPLLIPADRQIKHLSHQAHLVIFKED